jgi:hypothetical protein
VSRRESELFGKLYRKPSDGSGAARAPSSPLMRRSRPTDWSSDGKSLIYAQRAVRKAKGRSGSCRSRESAKPVKWCCAAPVLQDGQSFSQTAIGWPIVE